MTLPKIKCAAQRLNRSEPLFSELFFMVLRFGHSRRHVIVGVSIVSYRSLLVREVVAKTTCLGCLGSRNVRVARGQKNASIKSSGRQYEIDATSDSASMKNCHVLRRTEVVNISAITAYVFN